MRETQHRFRRSNLELRGPKNGLNIGLQRSRGVLSVPQFAQIPNLPTKVGPEGVQGRELANSQAPIRNPPIRNPHNPLPL
eukprot:1807401-Alexandrium_andersonii.AAC.1